MIRLVLALAVLLTSAPGGPRQQKASPDRRTLDGTAVGLQLTASITGERFCSGDADVYTEALDLAGRYTNMGKKKLTVLTGTDVPATVLVARTAEDLKAAKYEALINWDSFPMGGGRYLLGSNPKSEKSASLEPGQSVTSMISTAVLVQRPGTIKVPGTVATGEHNLEIRMQIRVRQGKSGTEIARGGEQIPSFRWVSVLSDPITFEVPASPTLQDCPAKPY
jgi:hypothetical protein